MKFTITPRQRKLYEKIAEDATVDCNDEYEQTYGWECVLDENILAPCPCRIGKLQAMLEKVSMDDTDNVIIGVIRLNKTKMRILLQDIVLDDQKAMQYINAYKHWCKHG